MNQQLVIYLLTLCTPRAVPDHVLCADGLGSWAWSKSESELF